MYLRACKSAHAYRKIEHRNVILSSYPFNMFCNQYVCIYINVIVDVRNVYDLCHVWRCHIVCIYIYIWALKWLSIFGIMNLYFWRALQSGEVDSYVEPVSQIWIRNIRNKWHAWCPNLDEIQNSEKLSCWASFSSLLISSWG